MATKAAEPRARRYDPAETRQRVLEAANMLFSTKGFVSTGTADIARAADVSEGSIFYHFGSKKNLLIELGRQYGENMIAAMDRGEGLEKLTIETTMDRCFDYCATHKQWEAINQGGQDRIGASSPGAHFHDPEAEPFYRASREVVVAWTEAHMRAQLGAQGITNVDIPIAASFVYAAVGDALDRAFGAGATPAEREAIKAETVRFVSAACGYRS
ncbi:MAG: TetR/AcrR family transcriptional regulator [Sphingomonadaceae bacterium]|nr:TetR/AcrR family transcriptional regulator [Sphingomonadaceae bacterium]